MNNELNGCLRNMLVNVNSDLTHSCIYIYIYIGNNIAPVVNLIFSRLSYYWGVCRRRSFDEQIEISPDAEKLIPHEDYCLLGANRRLHR
jgi:hypothetical protein